MIETENTVMDLVKKTIADALSEFPGLIGREDFEKRSLRYIENRPELSFGEAVDQLVLRALEQIDRLDGRPDWTFVATRLYLKKLYMEAGKNRGYDATKQCYGSFYDLICQLTEYGIYTPKLLQDYTEQEIHEIGSFIDNSRDQTFTYIGLRTLADRYMAKAYDKMGYELPQERFLIIAMSLMRLESKENRLSHIKQAYEIMSKRYMTVATPTFSNAGKTYGQFSSCFIDTVGDDLRCIYDSNSDVADLSKNGGGLGLYLGKIRAKGSDIKGFPGVSSGVIPWMKQLNNTAVSVDQLGQRQGAIAVYLDAWHKDILSFLDVRLNNGDERQRTHDLFTGVCIPDIFMEAVRDRTEWYVFDPHTIDKVLDIRLEDLFDEKRGSGSFRSAYQSAVVAAEEGLLGKQGVLWDKYPAIEVMKSIMKSQLETGTPYMFYRDEVNRMNPNRHEGIIYASNLCTEIAQNMSITQRQKVERTPDGKIVITQDPGDFVVCNLSSINVGGVYIAEGEEGFYPALEKLIYTQVRMLDNVIDLNNIPVMQAQMTNEKYRSIGLGTFGWHLYLASKNIDWESPKAVEETDRVYEFIAFHTIRASMMLAIEKGAYSVFEGSDWQTGDYFTKRRYVSEEGTTISSHHGLDWAGLAIEVSNNGIRNAYLMAVAPNSTTSIIAGSTASIDPIFKQFYSEEKKDYKIPVVAPNLNPSTNLRYRSAFVLDQKASILQNAKRQRHIDQAISFNIYVQNDVKAKDLLDLHLTAWENELKTTYYVRSTSDKIEDLCESCSS